MQQVFITGTLGSALSHTIAKHVERSHMGKVVKVKKISSTYRRQAENYPCYHGGDRGNITCAFRLGGSGLSLTIYVSIVK